MSLPMMLGTTGVLGTVVGDSSRDSGALKDKSVPKGQKGKKESDQTNSLDDDQ